MVAHLVELVTPGQEVKGLMAALVVPTGWAGVSIM